MHWNVCLSSKIRSQGLTIGLAAIGTMVIGWEQPAVARGDQHSPTHRYGDEYDYHEERYEDSEEVYGDRTWQTITGLTQQSNLIGACRYSLNSLDVYRDAARTQRILTIVPDTELRLTGVVGTGVAEIYSPALGWISTATIEACDAIPAPEPAAQACYEILTTVTVRSGPDGSYPGIGQIRRGGIAYATTNPPTVSVSRDRRRWIEIYFPRQGQGWFSLTGSGGAGQNAVRLPDEQCDWEG
ncbi:hypothetical protein [Thermocoleostomius sinensis]|uniref:SH3 domain-containing protein n=1 Tax=Thermocoleostomius sinensis A174 TaxID=2016057 RepID=A0A9E8ZAA9_9CYAN|nr:hypothetical protein [Thermocoleostomius sinensis]WAL59196.1 hypothetical protein OXH18_18755 [Thermocoleostomius sinensis A174]